MSVIDSGFYRPSHEVPRLKQLSWLKKWADLDNRFLARIEEVKEKKTELYIGVSTLKNLVKGGRIRVTDFLSSLLNIRVVMEMKDHC